LAHATDHDRQAPPRTVRKPAWQDREFSTAIREGREPNASVARVLHDLEQQLPR
jgi:hypothetical protein